MFFPCYLLLLYSCQSATTEVNKGKCDNDSIVKNVPLGELDTSMQRAKMKILHFADLEDLQNGFDESQIRIWFSYSATTENVLIFSKTNNEWTGSNNRLEFLYDSISTELTDINRTSKPIIPKSGWSLFTDSLFKLGLHTMPDMTEIPGYELNRDGHWITIEYADCKIYRLVRYQFPQGLTERYPEAKRIVDACRLIERHFGLSDLGQVPF